MMSYFVAEQDIAEEDVSGNNLLPVGNGFRPAVCDAKYCDMVG